MTINDKGHAYLRRPRARRERVPLLPPEKHEVFETMEATPIQLAKRRTRRKGRLVIWT